MTSKSLLESLNPKGHLEIIKRHSNGFEETVLDDHNVITVGMGITLAHLFSASSSSVPADDYKIAYFQIGTGSSTMVSSVTKLHTPISAANYGETDLSISSIDIATESVVKPVAFINPSYINKTSSTKVTYSLVLEEEACPSIAIKEIGLYSKNPAQQGSGLAYLCCYRSFAAITKTDAFALIFKWTLEF